MEQVIKRTVLQAKPKVNSNDELDLDLGELGDPYPLIPEGDYKVMFVKAHEMDLFKEKRLITYWRINDLESEYHGNILIMGFQFPKRGKKKWGPMSKFAQCFRIAQGRNPDRFDVGRVSTKVFKHKVFLARVRTVTSDRDAKNDVTRHRSKENHYSVIDTLLTLQAGAHTC